MQRTARLRFPALVAWALAVAAILASPIRPAEAGRSSHPHFDDQGTLVWFRTFAEAQAAARAQGKLIFVDYGRLRCSQCRTLCTEVLPDPRVRARLSRVAVGLASNCDRPEQSIRLMFQRHLPRARMLPFIAFVTPDGEYVTGFGGSCRVERFLAHLQKAERLLPSSPPASVERAPQVRPQPAPRPQPRPVAPPSARSPGTPAPGSAPAVCPKVVRPERHRVLPPPSPLAGSPDAVAVAEPQAAAPAGCCAPPRIGRPAGPLPPPRIRIMPPVRVRGGQAVPARTRRMASAAPTSPAPVRHAPTAAARRTTSRPTSAPAGQRAQAAAERGAWDEVMTFCARTPGDPKLEQLHGRARNWADERLTFAVDSVADGSYRKALDAVEEVLIAMRGEPESIDAARGLSAIKTLLELQYMSPEGDAAQALRRRAYEDMWGTRWARLFS